MEQELVEAEVVLRSHCRLVCRNYIAIEATWELKSIQYEEIDFNINKALYRLIGKIIDLLSYSI